MTLGQFRKWLTGRAVVVLVIAALWGQVKTILTLWVGAMGDAWPYEAQWTVATGISVVLTLACYWSTSWAEKRIAACGSSSTP